MQLHHRTLCKPGEPPCAEQLDGSGSVGHAGFWASRFHQRLAFGQSGTFEGDASRLLSRHTIYPSRRWIGKLQTSIAVGPDSCLLVAREVCPGP